ncbi:MAG: hypothetical protein ORN51_14370 [Akkermansiaceae bacterium]|nr:hypothetical protein [Akkermansiaceae bacterium]
MSNSDQDNLSKIYEEIRAADVKIAPDGGTFAKDQEREFLRLQRQVDSECSDTKEVESN